MSLKSNVIKVDEITYQNKLRMFNIMNDVYNGTTFEKFISDLANKNYVLMLYDSNNLIQGFTTIQIYDENFEGKPVKILYSGDTVIDQKARGDIELMRAWWRFSFEIQQRYKSHDVYWFLISKGWRTYKFFPLFLKDFYPNVNKTTPKNIQNFMNKISKNKFGDLYRAGIIYPKNPDYLKSGLKDVPEHKKQDKDVIFFLEKNPEYYKGNELVCLAKLHPDNLTKAGLRLLHGVKNE